MRTTPKKPYEGQARAKFNFVAQTNLELSLAKGKYNKYIYIYFKFKLCAYLIYKLYIYIQIYFQKFLFIKFLSNKSNKYYILENY